MLMDLESMETALGISFPKRHREALFELTDPIHEACDFLVIESQCELLRLREVNDFLHDSQHPDKWPEFLVAFASNGCGDYFAYDLRSQPPQIIYMDPDRRVDENLSSDDKLTYESFEDWYDQKLQTYRLNRDQSGSQN
jgi:hypothetical protein